MKLIKKIIEKVGDNISEKTVGSAIGRLYSKKLLGKRRIHEGAFYFLEEKSRDEQEDEITNNNLSLPKNINEPNVAILAIIKRYGEIGVRAFRVRDELKKQGIRLSDAALLQRIHRLRDKGILKAKSPGFFVASNKCFEIYKNNKQMTDF